MPVEALIGAAGSVLGGLFGKKKTVSAGANFQSHIDGLMKAAEKHKFNPLSLLGVNPIGPSETGGSYMGQAIADASLMLADGLARDGAEAKLTRAEAQNEFLRKKVSDLTIRPTVPGVYEQRLAYPSVREAVGGSDAAKSGASDDYDPSLESPFAADAVHDDGGGLSPVQASIKKDVPAFRAFGHDWFGTGLFSTGETFETALGEPGSWAAAPMIALDAFANETWKLGSWLGGEAAQKVADYKYSSTDGGRKPPPKRGYDMKSPKWARPPDTWQAGSPGWFINGDPNRVTFIPPKR